MLIQVNDSDYDLNTTINQTCGKEYSFINRILKNNFGSSKYKLLEISPSKFNIDLKNYTDSVYLNFDLRDNGIVFFFRFKNTEYVELCHTTNYHFNQMTILLCYKQIKTYIDLKF